MDLIVTHRPADFDALASMVAAGKLYPSARLMFPGSPEAGVRDFMKLCQDVVKIETEKGCRLDDVDRLIMVDTRLASRIGKAQELIKKGVEVHIYDHHPRTKEDVKAEKDSFQEVGATATILLGLIRKRNINITPLEATIMALGIYEDTGSLTYLSTTRRDIDGVGFLLSKGANLRVVASCLKRELTPHQTSLLVALLNSIETYIVDGIRAMIATTSSDKYIQDLALLTHKLRDIEGPDCIFTLCGLPDRVQLVARSQSEDIDVGRIASFLGGGGHNLAASCVVRGRGLVEVKEELLKLLARHVKGKVSKKVPEAVEATRDLRALPQCPMLTRDVAKKMKNALPSKILSLLELVGKVADATECPAFVVGGFVRDLLLGGRNYDVDIVIEGDINTFGKALADRLKGALVVHKKFKTASVVLPDKFKIDIATARRELYEYPAALPVVSIGHIKEDLARRDFTINAMAIRLNRGDFGKLYDFFGGQADLKKGQIRVLHHLSFVDDPTRIFRAVRFEQRYNFSIDKYTGNLIKTAMSLDMFEKTSGERLREEITLILREEKPLKAIKRMDDLHELRFIHPAIRLDRKLTKLLERVEQAIDWFKLSFIKKGLDLWLVWLLALIDQLSFNQTQEVLNRFPFRRKDKDKILSSKREALSTLGALEVPKTLRASQVYKHLNTLADEVILWLMARAKTQRAKKRISSFLLDYGKVKLAISGRDLEGMGLEPSPEFKQILLQTLYAKVDGKLRTKQDELRFAKKLIRQGLA